MSCRTEVGKLAGERAALLKKLVEVEMDGKAAGEQMIKLRDTVRRLKEVNLVCMFYLRYSTNKKKSCIPYFPTLKRKGIENAKSMRVYNRLSFVAA